MNRTLVAFLWLLLAFPALGQTPGAVALTGPSTTPGAPQLTPAAINAAINAALAAKQDCCSAGGNLTAPGPIGSVTPNTGAFTTLGASNYQISNEIVVRIAGSLASPGQALAVGAGAGAALGPLATYETFVGGGSGNSFNSNGQQEVTCVGAQSAYLLTSSADHVSCFGLWSLHYSTADVGIASFGDNNMRNMVGASGVTSFGSNAFADFFGANSTGIGFQSLHGNSAAVKFGGTFTNGDVITLTFTSAGIGGGAASNTYTVQGGDTCANVVAGFNSTVGGVPALAVADLKTWADTLYPCLLAISWRGTSTLGTVLTVTSGVSGAATETVTITGGSVGTSNNAVGYEALYGLQMSSAQANNGFGRRSLPSLTTGSFNNFMGEESGIAATTANFNDAIGTNIFHSLTTGFFDVGLGFENGKNCTTCQQVTLLGAEAGHTTLTTAQDVVLITSGGNACDTNTSHSAQWCGSGGTWLTATGTDTPATSSEVLAGHLTTSGDLSAGTTFTVTGCSASSPVGGAAAGSFASGSTAICTFVITIDGATGLTAPHGWACAASDITTGTAMPQSATSATTCSVKGATTSGDTVVFQAKGY